ncbi:MAG: patatin-like phospholipase family protein [Polyangiaceae bacterium]
MRPSIVPVAQEPRIGLVLSGGGMRGAYEVGVVEGIVEALGTPTHRPSPFRVFAGTSVGAINASYLAANTHRADMDIERLRHTWISLEIERHLRFDPLGFLSLRAGLRRAGDGSRDPEHFGRSLLDPRPLESMIGGSIEWETLHDNVDAGRTLALLVAALDVATGKTTIFSEVAPAADFRPSRDPRRRAEIGQIGDEHVLASAAIPLLFPARRIGASYYCDGGLRFNTPISPAIRAGSDRLVVITLSGTREEGVEPEVKLDEYPGLFFLAGKVMNALLLDQVVYDLAVLKRFNHLVAVLEQALPPQSFAEVERLLIDSRGAPYRRIETLVFSPSEDLGAIAQEHLERHLDSWRLSRIPRWLLGVARGSQADWAAYLLFDGGFAERLIELGRKDALARSQEIREFFGAACVLAP